MLGGQATTHAPMRWMCLCLFLLGCGDDDGVHDAGTDAPESDAALSDAGIESDAPTDSALRDGSTPDTSIDAPMVDEDCTTDTDEDGNGFAGCADPVCWEESRCFEEELADNGVSGWALCGDVVELDETETAAVCDDGIPFPTERDFDCGRVPTTARLEVYCEPDEGPGRALRYVASMDLTSIDESLGPMSGRHTSFTAELGYFGTLYLAYGGGGSSSSDPIPTREAWVREGHRASAWVVAQTGTQVIVLLGASSQTSTFTVLEDGGVVASSSDPVFFLTAGLNASL